MIGALSRVLNDMKRLAMWETADLAENTGGAERIGARDVDEKVHTDQRGGHETDKANEARAPDPLSGADQRTDRLPITQVRHLVPDEWRVVRDIALDNAGKYPLDFTTTRADVEKRTEQDYRNSFNEKETFVAFHGDKPIGWTRSVFTDDPEVLEMVAVLVYSSARGTGIGDRLIQIALGWARDNNYREVRLWVRGNNEPAKNLYLRAGFQFTGESKPHWKEASLRSLKMRHDLE